MNKQNDYQEIDNDAQKEFYKKQREKLKKFFIDKNFLIIFIAVSIFIIDISVISFLLIPDDMRKDFSNKYLFNEKSKTTEDEEKKCNVAGINLHGDLVTYILPVNYDSFGNVLLDESSSEDIYFTIKNIEKQDDIKAIIIDVDSFGGYPAAAEEINFIIKKTEKPVIAYIRSAGDSAAYWAISGADRIFSLSTSQVGSIAVNSSYLDNAENNEQNGYNFNDISTGEFKNVFNPDKPLTKTERDMIMKDLQETHNLFVNTVAENRNLEVSSVKEIANGWSYTGDKALNLGLVDEIGNLDSIKEYIEKNILDNQEVDICWN